VKEVDVAGRAESALRACFDRVPDMSFRSITREVCVSSGACADLVVDVVVRDRPQTILVELKSSGEPRIARAAIAQLEALRQSSRFADAYAVFIAPYISDRTSEILRDAGIGYVDLAGNCLLSLGDVYVERSTSKNLFKDKRSRASIFAPKSSRVLRVLLGEPDREWQVQEIAEAASISIGLVSRVKTALLDREWLTAESTGVRLIDPETTLRAWTENYDYKINEIRSYYSLEEPAKTEAKIATYCQEEGIVYSLSGFSGARLRSPRVRYSRVTAYVESSWDRVAQSVDLKEVDSGPNTQLLKPYDDGVFMGSEYLHRTRVASPVQLYLDLSSMAGRGEEAAEEILRKELLPKWHRAD